ncbi:Ig-like domain repeat protein [Cellulomonas sp. DKR-3]|uniref:Ig-like domain repeat protein n=1 Tax=Cellulomonas fulva TaxID=2835530 RepID=A0ABS5TYS8_9CELL|nr:Ig-like domain repeat protein [Cellulomonas fulva]MBT0994313.1 Ig-like domain repeat protein [Cellulomonas fulva]
MTRRSPGKATARPRPRSALASVLCAALATSGAVAVTAVAAAPATAASSVTITPNPAYAGAPFEGWGNSLVWFANATGDYPDALRDELFELVFGADGLNMNVARYNVGGGRASDVGDYFRQGAAVDGYWAQDTSTDPDSLYGALTTNLADHRALAAAWDPDDEASYDWSQDATQRWWLEKLANERDDLVLEGFANSPPWFMTSSGYTSGGASATSEQVLATDGVPAKFTAYLTRVVEHLEDTYGVEFQSVDPFNEPCTGYWSTPTGRLADGITPFTNAVKKPQEGAQICPGTGAGQQQSLVGLLADDLAASSSDAVVSANDETNPGNFNTAWAQYDEGTRADVGQINVHSYGTNGIAQARDYALAADKTLWMSETGGDFVGSGFDPVSINGALGLAQKITSDLRTLQPDAYVLWQEVEDFYNMEKGEKLNWGSVFVDFDCEYVDAAGDVLDPADAASAVGFKSQRRVADALAAGDDVASVEDCHIVTNSKFDAMRNFMHYITAGDRLVPTDDAASTAAVDADGTGASIVHTNAATTEQTVTVDLTGFGTIASDATVTPVVTTQAADVDDTSTALVEGTPVAVDAASGTATLTIPARSVVTFVVDGVSGVADEANPLVDGGRYQAVGVQSGKALARSDAATLQIKALATTAAALPAQEWVVHETTAAGAPTSRRTFALENASDGSFLGATSAGTRFEQVSLETARSAATTTWHLVTLDGTTWSLVNDATASSLDVGGQSTADGAPVGIYGSNGGANQLWTFRSTDATPTTSPLSLRTTIGTPAALPATIVPTYAWGDGVATPVTWDAPADAWDRAGTVTVTATGTDIYGNAVTATAVVQVGDVVATDPVSMTVVAGTSVGLVGRAAPATVPAQVGTASARFDVPVTWDLDALDADAFAEPGVVTVAGTVSAEATGSVAVDATLHVVVTPAATTAENVALTSTPSATYTEPGYPASRTVDGDRTDKGWSNWRGGTKNTSDTLTYVLAQERVLTEARLYFFKDGSSSTWPTTVTTQYRDAGTQAWQTLSPPVTLADQATAPVATVDLSGATADAVRFVLAARDATHLIVSETEIDAVAPAASSVSSLARLSVDGVDVSGFDAQTTAYDVPARGSAPRVVGVPTDASATVTTERSGDTVTLTVTAVDGSATTYTVVLDLTVGLTAVHVEGSPVAGQELTAAATTDPVDAALTYQWAVDGQDVPGATSATWTPGLEHVGSAVTVTVTATAEGFGPTTSTSAPVEVLDGRAASSVALVTSATKVVEGATVRVTATVTSDAASALAGGTVELRDGAAVVASAEVGADGTARFTLDDLAVGTHALSAAFRPAAAAQTQVAPSSSATVAVTVVVRVVASTTTLKVVPAAPTTTTRPVANVTVRTGTSPAAGKVTVTVKRGSTTVKTLTQRLTGGRAAVRLPALTTPGTYTVTARYAGQTGVRASSATTKVTVRRTTVTTVRVASTVRSTARATVAVKVTGKPAATITGKVTVRVYRGGKQVAVRGATLSRSAASVTLPRLTPGTYTVRAVYAGTSTAVPSTSATASFRVVR